MLLVFLMVFFYLAPVYQTQAGWTEAAGWIFTGGATVAAAVGFVATAPVSMPATVIYAVGIVGVGAGAFMGGLGIGEILAEVFGDSSS